MKKIVFPVVMIIAVFVMGCRKSSDTTNTNPHSIIGKWILTESLTDPGDGSGTWQPADKPGFYYLVFGADSSSLQTNLSTGYGSATNYKLLSDSTLRFTFSNGSDRTFYYRLADAQLTITGGCIEACGSRFRKSGIAY